MLGVIYASLLLNPPASLCSAPSLSREGAVRGRPVVVPTRYAASAVPYKYANDLTYSRSANGRVKTLPYNSDVLQQQRAGTEARPYTVRRNLQKTSDR